MVNLKRIIRRRCSGNFCFAGEAGGIREVELEMRIAGLIVILLGWVIAVSSVTLGSTAAQIFVALLGFVTCLVGIIGVLNRAHLANAIWKQ